MPFPAVYRPFPLPAVSASIYPALRISRCHTKCPTRCETLPCHQLQEANQLLKAKEQRSHEDAARYFAYGIVGIIAIFTILHWTRFIYKRYLAGSSDVKVPVSVSRISQAVFMRKVPGFVSGGHVLIFLAYLAVSLGILFGNLVEFTDVHEFAKHLGWLAACNLCLTVFLALKNTPLAFLTSYSHERLNPLHQIAGYSAIASTLAYGVFYFYYWCVKTHSQHELKYMVQRMAYVAFFCMLILLCTTFLLRKRHYEIFYILHLILALLILTTSALHRPKIATRSVIILIVAGGIWGLDRLIRFSTFAVPAIGNKATITPLPHGGTRIVLKRKMISAKPGMHCFVWIPGVRSMESHPFTIISTSPVELVVAAYDGFTRDLHTLALKNPAREMIASVDGPYCIVPDFKGCTRVVFIAEDRGRRLRLVLPLNL